MTEQKTPSPAAPAPSPETKSPSPAAETAPKKAPSDYSQFTAPAKEAEEFAAGKSKPKPLVRKISKNVLDQEIDWDKEPLVVVEAITTCLITDPRDRTNIFQLDPTERAEVPLAYAKDLCRPIEGSYAFSGERDNKDARPRHKYHKAKIVNEKIDQMEKKLAAEKAKAGMKESA